MNIREILGRAPVVPVLVIDKVGDAVPLARALVSGGLPVLEVTLRTEAAWAAIDAMVAEVPDAIVGGWDRAAARGLRARPGRGARFAVSPGLTPALAAAARASQLPYLPGVMTPGEVMAAVADGHTALKLFPAQQAGGLGMLKALGAVFRDVVFCPTGGITADPPSGLPGAPQRRVRGRIVGGSVGRDRRGRLGPDHHAGPRGQPAPLGLAGTVLGYARSTPTGGTEAVAGTEP